MKKFPFINLNSTLVLLRVSVALIFLAHTLVRIMATVKGENGTIARFAGFLEQKGFPLSTAIVWSITVYEFVGGLLLLAGIWSRWIASGFIVMLVAGIFIIHAANGWFVGEHGSGGMEYSFILIIALIVIAAANRK